MKKTLIIIAVVVVVVLGGLMILRVFAKSKSPEKGFDFVDGNLKIHVFYNQPSKRGREIFAVNGLVPYGAVWRTGANEATYIEFSQPVYVKGQKLSRGKYSIWTIPGPETWQVIFNSEVPRWGINYTGVPNRNPKTDAAIVEVPVTIQDNVVELFTISVEKVNDDMELTFWWDRTIVAVPISVSAP